MKWISLFIGLFVTLGCSVHIAHSESPHEQSSPVSLMLQWTPQAQFAGYFVAQEKGFYKDQGLDLTIIAGGPDKVVSDYLDSSKVDFGTMFLATALERRDAGIPLVNIGQFIQHSTLMLIAKRETGINKLEDLHQRKVSLWANEFQIQPYLLFQQLGISVEIVPLASSMDLLLRDAVAATSAMWYNEYHTVLSAGYYESELIPFFFRDSDFDFPEDGIYCLEETFHNNPDQALGIIKATIAGWQYAFAHEDEALQIVAEYMEEAKLPVNKAHQQWMFKRMRDVMLHNGIVANHTILDKETFIGVNQHLLEGAVIRKPVVYDDFYVGQTHE